MTLRHLAFVLMLPALTLLFCVPARSASAQTTPRLTYRGQVLDARCQPLAGATVCLVEQVYCNSTRVLARRRTGADGRFQFSPIAAPREDRLRYHVLLVTHKGYAWAGQRLAPSTPETAPEPVTFTLEKPATLAGRVVNRRGEGIAGARLYPIVVYVGADFVDRFFWVLPGLEELTVQTDAQGRFRFEQLPSRGRLGLRVEHPDYATGSSSPNYDGVGFAIGREDVRIELGPPGRIEGQLRRADSGAPVAGVTLLVEGRRQDSPHGSEWLYASATTDAQGRFSATNLPPLPYTIGAQILSGGEAVIQPRMSFSLEEGQTLKGLSFSWNDERSAARFEVRGRVIDAASGRGLAGAEVRAREVEPPPDFIPWRGRVVTDREGRFRLRVPAGKLALDADAQRLGYRPAEVFSTVVEIKGNLRDELRLPLVRATPTPAPVR